MKVLELLLYLLLINLKNPAICRVYKHDIHRKLAKHHRLWRGMASNTGKNYGGWLVYIKNNNDATIVCGGAYYAPLLVITSGNCIHPYTYDVNMSVEPTAIRDTDLFFALIDTIYYPPDFTYLDQYQDIALIRLNKPIKGKLIEFIALCDGPIKDNVPLMTIGWGFDSLDVQPMSLTPTNSTVTTKNLSECASQSSRRITFDTIFCATHPTDRRKCRYDGGCPIVHRNQLCGVVSWGPLCKDTSEPGLYTNITHMKKWIELTEESINNESD